MPGRRREPGAPTDLWFRVLDQWRPFDLITPGLRLLDDDFASAASLGSYEQLTPAPERRAATAGCGDGTLTLAGESPFCTLFRSRTAQEAPYASVVVDVASFAGTGGFEDTVLAGLVRDERNHVVAWYNHAERSAGLDAVVDGVVHPLGRVGAAVDAPCRLAFSLTGTTVAALVDDGAGFRPLLKGRLDGRVDLRHPETLAAYRNAFGVRAAYDGTIVLGGVQAGYFGRTGVRDPHVVTRADGSPLVEDGRVHLTMTHAGLGFFETAHCGVWTFDVAERRFEHVGSLFFTRDGTDAVYGDHATHVVLDEQQDRWVVATSTWGDFTGERVQVRHQTLPASVDLLRGVHVVDTRPLELPVADLPSEAVGQWDPHLVRIEGCWHVAFVNARAFFDFYPALARGEPGAGLSGLHLVGADPSKTQTEGVCLQRMGPRWYVLASNGDDSPEPLRDRYPVYDLAMGEVGPLDAPHPSNIPWPNVFPVPHRRGRSRWVMVTFDGTEYHPDVLGYGTHGDLLVLEARPLTPRQRYDG